jgi:hypothetical protein
MVAANGIVTNGTSTSALPPGHFLFTSESVGEGHPGVPIFFHRTQISLIRFLQTKSVTKSQMLS